MLLVLSNVLGEEYCFGGGFIILILLLLFVFVFFLFNDLEIFVVFCIGVLLVDFCWLLMSVDMDFFWVVELFFLIVWLNVMLVRYLFMFVLCFGGFFVVFKCCL